MLVTNSLMVGAVLGAIASAGPFASEVIEYAPAPGQFVNHPAFSDPTKALGPPVGGGTHDGNESSVVTLGGFGGYVVLGFEQTVENDPLNPFGMDAIVFGNAFWVGGNPQRHWAECGVIEIAFDANGNGRADDTWYLIPGSHITDLEAQLRAQTWDDRTADPTYPPELASWIPPGRSGTWLTEGFLLPVALFGTMVIVNPSPDASLEGIYGYADFAPTLVLGDLDADDSVEDPALGPEVFYTRPDDPLAVGITPGSCGGDAFDIAWAVHPATGQPARLPGFDFIRITTGTNVVLPLTGELSTEIDAVADAAPDPFGDFDDDGDIDLADTGRWQNCPVGIPATSPPCGGLDRDENMLIEMPDFLAVVKRLTGPK